MFSATLPRACSSIFVLCIAFSRLACSSVLLCTRACCWTRVIMSQCSSDLHSDKSGSAQVVSPSQPSYEYAPREAKAFDQSMVDFTPPLVGISVTSKSGYDVSLLSILC